MVVAYMYIIELNLFVIELRFSFQEQRSYFLAMEWLFVQEIFIPG